MLGCFLCLNPGFSFEFDNEILESLGFDNVDLTIFNGSENKRSGEYIANIQINEQDILRNHSIYYYVDGDHSRLCFTEALLQRLPFKSDFITKVQKAPHYEFDSNICYGVEDYDSQIHIDFNEAMQQINIQMPHAYITDFDPNWVPPAQRDHGISGLVFDYNLLQTFNRHKTGAGFESRNNLTSYGAVGINIGRFRLRSNYQYDKNSHSGQKLEWVQTYGFTDIGAWNAHLYAGEIYTRTNLFDSTRIKGVSLFTDENMMPNYLQGYAPQITGTARTNAIVTIKQYGSIIKSVQVPPGPFIISNLPSYLNGVVDVSVEESDGSVDQYQVNISQVPFLTRKGALRYNINAGKLSPFNEKGVDTNLIAFDGSYGLTNNISLLGGAQYTTNGEYLAVNTGAGINLENFGAISFDVTHSINKADSNRVLKGHSYRFNYAKRFDRGTTLNLVGYRFSSRDYTNLNNYIQQKSLHARHSPREKQHLSISVSQTLPIWDINFTASVSRSRYWNNESQSHYNISANKIIRDGLFANTSIALTLSHKKSKYSPTDNQVGLFINIPLESPDASLSYSGSMSNNNQNVSQQVSYSDAGLGGRYSIGAAVDHPRNFSDAINYNLSASYYTNFYFGGFTGMGNYSEDQQSLNTSFNGSLTLTQHGITAQPQVYDEGTRLIIDANAPGVEISGVPSKTNLFGIAGISNIPDYYRMTYQVDNDNLPDNVEIQDNVIEVAATKGAIAYRSLKGITGEKSLSTITLPDGSYPPFGAGVYRIFDQKEMEVAIVADRGRTYITGLNKTAIFIIKWGATNSCRIEIPSMDPHTLQQLTCYPE
ncbi:fimbrial outer membrane usher protein StdB [Ignatzschineria ureiclastica]|nr:fimbrial outer membrane usher protein StdB [Ignatzschineria ureiclastica]